MTPSALQPWLAVLQKPPIEQVPQRIRWQAERGGWPDCDVCGWPLHPAAVVPGQSPRHPACVCMRCKTPLLGDSTESLRCPRCVLRPGIGMTTFARPDPDPRRARQATTPAPQRPR